jgi:uncharacterized protein (DUF488 family)
MNQGIKLFTIGVYGSTEMSFFATLQASQVDVFCDVRQRRGMRGALYSYVNSIKLQERLAELGIRYFYLKQFAPPPEIRNLQKKADAQLGILKKNRNELDLQYVSEYEDSCLRELDAISLVDFLSPQRGIVFFCVERNPNACHRLLLADRIARQLNLTLENLFP